ncbi:hypothetical protein E1B28_007801 [Marasmius oreades]|uniref:Uncharacterized protein n=1 Tax=Marasmius oreades TaxID=181124 RepID=A0A9P7S2A6_9AGAR|nr:uncharacterized protein E1B28_007801 [Marasmius oreades]KAG7094194.1 hypothetical protein E1B28_007801 [Marasmius oreades]
MDSQKFQDPFVAAIILDRSQPHDISRKSRHQRSPYLSRALPTSPSEYHSIPLTKVEDFGVHANQHYK